MPVKATPFIKLLQSVLEKPIDARLDQVRSIIPSVEKRQIKNTEPLARELIKVLTSVMRSSDATPEQLRVSAEFRARVDAIDPRNEKNREAQDSGERPKPPKPEPKTPDFFEPVFIDPVAAIARVIAQYSARPRWTPLENERLLQTALGNIVLDAHSVVQLWLALAYDFKNRLKCVESSMLPQSLWITAAICQYVNTRHILVPRPNCFENVTEEFAFRA